MKAGERAPPVGGTPLYMAPEQWNGEGPATPATDIYAATAVFFECLTGQTPFSGGTASSTWRCSKGANREFPWLV